MIRQVHIWSNGMVLVFDERGKQVPVVQGPIHDVLEDLKQVTPPDAEYFIGIWNEGVQRVEPWIVEFLLAYEDAARKWKTPEKEGGWKKE